MRSHAHEVTLGLAFVLGALHAIEPGHGKTAMLVYLSGERRSFWHPVVMGLSSVVAHSVSLIAVALGVHWTHHLVSGDFIKELPVAGGIGECSVVVPCSWSFVRWPPAGIGTSFATSPSAKGC